jgi:stage 0 sporulation protein B (sporulation initiation phosphotransferase)
MKSEWIKSEEMAGEPKETDYALPGEDAGADPNLRLIRLFNHYRHDWMNDIQLIFGYVKLKKYDKLEDLMEKIKDKVQREGFVSRLGNSELIAYLLSFQAEVKDIRLEVELKREVHLNELPLDGNKIYRLLKAFVERFKAHAAAHPGEEHGLSVELMEEDDRLRVMLNYAGVAAAEHLSRELEQARLESELPVHCDFRHWDGRRTAVHIEIPFRT